MGCGVRVTGCGVRVTGCGVRVTGCGMRGAGAGINCELGIKNYEGIADSADKIPLQGDIVRRAEKQVRKAEKQLLITPRPFRLLCVLCG